MAGFLLRSLNPIRLVRTLALVFFAGLLFYFYARNDPSWTTEYNWALHPLTHPVDPTTMMRLPTSGRGRRGKPSIRRIQYPFRTTNSPEEKAMWDTAELRRREVKAAFQHAWSAYSAKAWGWDELMPVSGKPRNTFNGWGATLIDALDSLWIMDMKNEFHDAMRHVARLDFNHLSDATNSAGINLFETNIRYLGGLLSAYDLSGERILLRKALELGNMLYAAFDTESHMPAAVFTPLRAKQGLLTPPGVMASAALGTYFMEFTRLAQLTGQHKFYDAVDRFKTWFFQSQDRTLLPGMWPITIELDRLRQDGTAFGIGAEADSLYEYLPKMYLLLHGTDKAYQTMWLRAATMIDRHLIFKPMTTPDDMEGASVLFPGNVQITPDNSAAPLLFPDTGHLDCFAGGMFALSARIFGIPRHLDIGERLARGCAWAYSRFPTGIMPEFLKLVPCPSRTTACYFNASLFEDVAPFLPKPVVAARDLRYLGRPEAIESIFVAFRTTGHPALLEKAWDMFQAIRNHTTAQWGHGQLRNVTAMDDAMDDMMESFWLAETLKYFYLIFSPPNVISLDEFVFNTEAHPFRYRTKPTFNDADDGQKTGQDAIYAFF